jgi:hypothetical protein
MGPEWPQVCVNSPYLDQVLRENEEILKKYRAEGCWFDVLYTPPGGCFCPWCLEERKALGLSASPRDLRRHNKMVAVRAAEKLTALARRHWPDALVFYNGRTAIGMRDELEHFTHIEIESLPTGGWGYTHFEHRVRYARTLGKQVVGLNGRFHKAWGDFGGLKNQAALDFEVLTMAANGAKARVGDQVHPRGRLDAQTFERIGRAFTKVEALEPYLKGASAVADIGVVSALAMEGTANHLGEVDAGCTNMLLELHQQFDILDGESDFSRYKLIVLPDEIPMSAELAKRLDAHARGGGSVLATHRSAAGWSALGVRLEGPSKYAQQFLFATDARLGLEPDYAYFLYQPGLSVAATAGTEVLAVYGDPYFDRTRDTFMGHAQTAVRTKTDRPVVTLRERVAYIANPVFLSYGRDAYGAHKRVVGGLVRELLPAPAVEAPGLPSTARLTVMRQRGRTVVHLLHYPTTRRGSNLDIIEEPGVLKDVTLRIRCAAAPARVALAPSGRSVTHRYTNGYVNVKLPYVEGYTAVAVREVDR